MFVDTGQVFGANENLALSGLRYAAGFGIAWTSPFGPLRVSIAEPLNEKKGFDKVERLQFTFGSSF